MVQFFWLTWYMSASNYYSHANFLLQKKIDAANENTCTIEVIIFKSRKVHDSTVLFHMNLHIHSSEINSALCTSNAYRPCTIESTISYCILLWCNNLPNCIYSGFIAGLVHHENMLWRSGQHYAVPTTTSNNVPGTAINISTTNCLKFFGDVGYAGTHVGRGLQSCTLPLSNCNYKLALLTYKVQTTSVPEYLWSLLQPLHNIRSLRSSTAPRFVVRPHMVWDQKAQWWK